jgi:predicted NAD/FAD-binding protein
MTVQDQNIAVIGSGVSGLASAWLLQYHGAKVTLYESEATCGGHTLTDHTSGYPVDLGFQVYNLTTYPHFVAWMEHLGLATEPSDMSFSISVDNGKLEWASHGLGTIFAQRKNCFDLSFLRMVWEVIRFGREAPKVLLEKNREAYASVTLGQYLDTSKCAPPACRSRFRNSTAMCGLRTLLVKGGRSGTMGVHVTGPVNVRTCRYGDAFRDNYVAPMCAAVWSVPYKQALEFPVQMLIRFWVNHHLLDIFQRPLWRVLCDRGEAYVKEVLKHIHCVRTSTPVQSVSVKTSAGQPHNC